MASNETSKYKLSVTEGTELQLSLNGPTGPTGPANVLDIGEVTTGETGTPASATITGSSPTQLLHLTLPKGNTGTAATIAVGSTSTGAAGSSASVTNSGSSSAAVFNFTIPKGDKGNTGTLSLGTVATGDAGTNVIITNTGTPEAGEFNFTIPRGDTGLTGPTGPPNQLSVSSTVTGEAGTEASVVISGTAPSQTLTFTIPRGNTGLTGPANQLSVNPTVTGAAGTNASVVISGTAPSQTLTFTIPRGDTGATGSSGAASLLTGFASAAGTVVATDTVLAAVGKLDGNTALRATTASLYPYIGGKLLTYADEEAAIADPLISGGDLYRKTAGGVDYVNPDNVPSLDLQFAADKTLTARRGPTPVLTRGSSATFVGSDGLIQNAANDEPRFDHDPVTLESKGLLIEGGRTNSITYSEDMTVANGWNEDLGAGTVAWSNNATTAPTGELTAEKLTEASTSSARRLTTKSAATVNGTTYILSVYAKASERSILQIGTSNGFVTATQNFDLSNGVLGTGGVAGASIVNVGSGWYRCSMQVVSNATGNSFFAFSIVPLANSARFTAYNGIIGYGIFLWGAQLEAGSFATSYIPTTTSALARSADVCSIIGTDFSSFYNQSEWTIFVSVIRNTNTGSPRAVAISDGTTSNRMEIARGSSSELVSYTAGGSFLYSLAIGGVAVGVDSRIAQAMKLNDFAASANGSNVATSNSGAMITANQMNIGSAVSGFPLNGTISAIRYYKKRLPDAKLQALTV